MLLLTSLPFFFQRCSLVLLALLLPGLSFAKNQESDWEIVADRNDIIVHKKLDPISGLAAFRGNTIVQEPDPYAFVALMNDFDSYPRWLHFVSKAEELEYVTPLHRYLRFQTMLPWPLKNREALLKATVIQHPAKATEWGDFIEILLTNEPDYRPPNPSFIRFPHLRGIFSFKWLSEDTVSITYELHLDPGGYIRPWLANIVLRDAPYFTLERLRRLIKSPAYHGQTFDYIEFNHVAKPVAE